MSRAAGFDRVASAQRIDDTLDTAAVLAHVRSEREVLIGLILRGQTWRGMLLPAEHHGRPSVLRKILVFRLKI